MKTITMLILLATPFILKAQTVDTLTKRTLIRVKELRKTDTIEAIMLVCDTSRHYLNETNWTKSQKVWWEYGQIIIERHNTLENVKPKPSEQDMLLYGREYVKTWYILPDDLLYVIDAKPLNNKQ